MLDVFVVIVNSEHFSNALDLIGNGEYSCNVAEEGE